MKLRPRKPKKMSTIRRTRDQTPKVNPPVADDTPETQTDQTGQDQTGQTGQGNQGQNQTGTEGDDNDQDQTGNDGDQTGNNQGDQTNTGQRGVRFGDDDPPIVDPPAPNPPVAENPIVNPPVATVANVQAEIPVLPVAPAAAAVVPQALNMNAVGWNDIDSLFHIMRDATLYNGVDLKAVRQSFLSKYQGQNQAATRDLALLLLTYIRAGNNVSKMNVKRKDINVSKEMISLSQRIGIVKKAASASDITYPRLALAFMAELLICRKFLVKDLSKQVDVALSVEYHDLAFAGCPRIATLDQYSEFHIEFSALIHKIKPKGSNKVSYGIDPKDPSFVKNHERWLKVASNGYARDKIQHERITAAMALTVPDGTNPRAVVWPFIEQGVVTYTAET